MSAKNTALQWAAQKAVDFFSRHPVVFFITAFLYILLPIDLIPELFAGPLGYIDDFIVLILPLLLRNYAKRNSTPPKDYYDTTAR